MNAYEHRSISRKATLQASQTDPPDSRAQEASSRPSFALAVASSRGGPVISDDMSVNSNADSV